MDLFLSFLKRKCSKSSQNVIFHAILANFGTIWPTQKHLALPTKYVKWLILSQKSLWISTTRKWIHFYLFWSEKVRNVPKMTYFMQFWPILGPYDPLIGPLHYQRSILNGSYFTKILHTLISLIIGGVTLAFWPKKCEKWQYIFEIRWSIWKKNTSIRKVYYPLS